MLSIIGMIAFSYFSFSVIDSHSKAEKSLIIRGDLIANMQAKSLSTALWNLDEEQIHDILSSIGDDPDLSGGMVVDEHGELVDKYGEFSDINKSLFVERDILYKLGEQLRKIGTIKIFLSKERIDKEFYHQLIFSSFAFLIIILLTTIAIFTSLRFIISPVIEVSEAMKKYAKGDKNVRIPDIKSGDEIADLTQSFATMKHDLDILQSDLEMQVSERTKQLDTERKKAEQASNIKSEFLANMSHEIRTPMNGVLGMASILAKTELSAEQREQLNLIVSSATSLLYIINDILDISKIEAGKLELEEIMFTPKQVFSDVKEVFTYELQAKNLYLKYELDESVSGFALGDPNRIKQILLNLISNATKFTKEGGITVKANFKDKILHVEVIDTGMGIPEDRVEKIFEKFEQSDSSVTRKFGGTGLGLAIVTELVHMMNGKLTVTSEIGKGSNFSFYLDFNK